MFTTKEGTVNLHLFKARNQTKYIHKKVFLKLVLNRNYNLFPSKKMVIVFPQTRKSDRKTVTVLPSG